MALPTIEVVYAPATEAVRSNPHDVALVKTPFGVLKQQEGLIKIYYGLQQEDKLTTYHFIAWETLEHHLTLMNDEETYPKLTGSVSTAFDTSTKSIQMIHVKPKSEPYKAFEAPVLEYAVFTLKDGQSKEALEGLVEEITNAINALPPSAGALHASWGPIVEDTNVFVLFAGWTSVEAHSEIIKTNQTWADIRPRVHAIAAIEAKHIALAAFE